MTTDTAMVEQLEVVALVKLAQLNVPTDVQEFLVQGNPMAGVAPHALRSAIVAVLECLRTPTPEMVEALLDTASPFVGRRTMGKGGGEVVQLVNEDWRTTIPLDDEIRHIGSFESERAAVEEADRLTVIWRFGQVIDAALNPSTGEGE